MFFGAGCLGVVCCLVAPYVFLEPTMDGVTIARWGPKSPSLVDADTSAAIIYHTRHDVTQNSASTKDQQLLSMRRDPRTIPREEGGVVVVVSEHGKRGEIEPNMWAPMVEAGT